MDLSVIIPCYNVENYIRECLSSIFTNSYISKLKVEIIIINDGSTDRTLELIKDFLETNTNETLFYKLISQKNKGLSYSRNRGFQESSGSYVYYLDSDDKIDFSKLLIIAEDCINNLYDVGVANYYELRENSIVKSSKAIQVEGTLKGIDVLNSIYLSKISSVVWRNIYNRSFLSEFKINFIEDVCFEDVDFMPKVFYHASVVHCYTDYFYYYRIREESIMRSKFTRKKFVDSLTIANSLSIFKASCDDVRVKGVLNRIISSVLISALSRVDQNIDSNDLLMVTNILKSSRSRFFIDSFLLLLLKISPKLTMFMLKMLKK